MIAKGAPAPPAAAFAPPDAAAALRTAAWRKALGPSDLVKHHISKSFHAGDVFHTYSIIANADLLLGRFLPKKY